MDITITGHQLQVTEAMKNYVHDKLTRLKHHSDRVMEVHVVLGIEKLAQKAEATLHLNGAVLFAEDSQPDMYKAIDGLTDKLDRQIIKHKEKHQGH